MKEIKLALKQHCSSYQEYTLSKFDEFFYTIKFIICWKLDLYPKEDYPDFIFVAYFNDHSYFSQDCSGARSWDYLAVGVGYFSNWFASMGSDTNC